MANNDTSAPRVEGAAVKAHSPMATRLNNESRFCAPTMSAAVCADSLAHSAFLETLSAVGSKKEGTLPELSTTLIAPDFSDPEATTLELNELWSFVLKRTNKRWIWIAMGRRTRQVVAYVIGDRSRASCQKLWERIPTAYRSSHCYSDFWEAYQLVLPAEQHTPAGKATGFTAHV